MPGYELVAGARFADDESEFVSAVVKGLYACWQENRNEDGLINAGSFELESYPKLLPEATILDVVNEGEDLWVRFLGNKLATRYPDGTGKALRDVVSPGLWLDRTIRICRAVIVTRRVLVNGPTPATFPGFERLVLEGLYVPMTLTGERVDRILIVNALWADRTRQS